MIANNAERAVTGTTATDVTVLEDMWAEMLVDMLFQRSWPVPSENKWCDFDDLLAIMSAMEGIHGMGTMAVVQACLNTIKKYGAEWLNPWEEEIMEQDSRDQKNRKRCQKVVKMLRNTDTQMRSLCQSHTGLGVHAICHGLPISH